MGVYKSSALLPSSDNCDVLQTVQSMEVDPRTGWMWIADVGRRDTFTPDPVNNCPPKLVVYDLAAGSEVFRHVFPDEVLGWESGYVNDIVVDPASVPARWAYMTDTGVNSQTGHNGGLVVYDVEADASWRVEHRTMQPDPNALDVTILGTRFFFDTPSDGIALSPDGADLFYTPLASYDLFSVPTAVLQVTRKCQEGSSNSNNKVTKIRRCTTYVEHNNNKALTKAHICQCVPSIQYSIHMCNNSCTLYIVDRVTAISHINKTKCHSNHEKDH